MTAVATSSEQVECCICLDDIPIRESVKCTYCKDQRGYFCRVCVTTFLKRISSEPHCPRCEMGWTDEYLRDTFGREWVVNEFREAHENRLWEREKALMPATMPRVEKRKELKDARERRDKLTRTQEEIRIQISKLQREIGTKSRAAAGGGGGSSHDTLDDLNKENKRFTDEIAALSTRINELDGILNGRSAASKDKIVAEYIMNCPAVDCRGFLNKEWKCGLCKTEVCKSCHVPIGKVDEAESASHATTHAAKHSCKKEDVETATEIMKTTRSCPKCHAPIFKIEGCDQMFCVKCHTAFSWETGMIETGRVHNPHYYQWLQMHGGVRREVDDVDCGGIPGFYHMNAAWEKLVPKEKLPGHIPRSDIEQINVYRTLLNGIHQFLTHWSDPANANSNPAFKTQDEGNGDYREAYLLGEKSETDMRRVIVNRHNGLSKRRSNREVLTLLVAGGGDILRNFIHDPDNYVDVYRQFVELALYVNSMFKRTAELWSGVSQCIMLKGSVVAIDDTFRIEYDSEVFVVGSGSVSQHFSKRLNEVVCLVDGSEPMILAGRTKDSGNVTIFDIDTDTATLPGPPGIKAKQRNGDSYITMASSEVLEAIQKFEQKKRGGSAAASLAAMATATASGKKVRK